MNKSLFIEIFLLAFLISFSLQANTSNLMSDTSQKALSKRHRISPLGGSPNQDCNSAKPICNNISFKDTSYGYGVQELNSSNAPCFFHTPPLGVEGEHQSSWYYFKVKTTGTLGFTIKSLHHGDDYDFAVWGPNANCPINVPPIRCNTFGDSTLFSLDSTGLSTAGVNPSEGPGVGRPFCTMLPVNAGEIYRLLVDNYSQKGPFSISFNGTATLDCDIVVPSVSSDKDTICKGSSATLTTKSVQTYNWYSFADTTTVLSTSNPFTIVSTTTTTYLVKGKSDANLPYRLTKVIVVKPLPTPTVTSNHDSICTNGSATFTALGGSSYKWANAASPSVVLSNTNTYIASSLPAGQNTFQVTVTQNGCSIVASKTITVIAKPVFTISAVKAVVCPNDSTLLSVSPTGYSYKWALASNPGVVLSSGTNLYGKAGLKYIVTATFQNLCSDTATKLVGLHIPPTVTASSTSPNNTICSGNSIKLKAKGAKSYGWYVVPGNTSFGSGDSIVPSPNPSITTTYLVVGTDNNGCTNSATVVVTVNPLPNVFVQVIGKDTVCAGQSATLLALNATSYSWRSSSTGSTVISTSSTINVTPTITTTYTVSGTDNNGCSNSYSRQIYVNALPTPKISPTNNPICPGDSSVLRARNAANCSFTWYIKGKGGALATSVDSLLRVGPKDTVRYVVKAINKTTGCIAYDTLTLIVNPKPQPQLITGLNSVCPGQTGLFYTVNKAFSTSTYFWRVKGGYIPNGQVKNGSTIQINWNNVVDTNAYIKVVETNKYNCTGDTITLAMRVEIKLHPSLSTIQGKDSICSRDVNGVQYMVNPTLAGYNYTWTVVGGTVVSTGGVGGSTININWDPNTSITHSIQYKEDNGTCYGSTPVKSIRIDPSPFNNKMKGRLSVCNGEQSTYELAGLQGSIYYWKLSKHTRAKYYRNDSTATVVINWPDSSKSSTDTLYVLEKSNKGCVGDTIKAVITINPPHSPKKISGPDYVCVGSNPNQVPVEGYTANKGATGSRYVWTVIGAEKYPDSKDSILKVRFSKSGQGNVVTINVYEMTKDSCLGLSISKQVRFDYTLPYMQQVSTQYSNEHYLQIRWDSSVNAQNIGRNYKLYRRILHSNNPWQKVGTYYANTYTDQDTSLNTGKYAYEYYYSTLDLCDDTVLAPGHNSILLQAKADEDKNTVSLNWTPYKGWRGAVKQYEVWRKMDSERDYSLYKTLSNVDTSVSYNNGTDGFTHRYRIRAVEDGSEQPRESWSNGAVVSFSHPIDIPTVFTPNGDGVNDTWVIKNMETYHQAEIQVFNRWGNEVFSNTGTYNNNWDGSSNGQKLPDGAYFFVIKLNQPSTTNKESYTGTISIVK